METKLIKREGKISMDRSFESMCSLLANGQYVVKIIRKTEPRSIPQNSLMWMWFQCMEESTGQPKEDFHEYFKYKFLGRQLAIGKEITRVAGSTTQLNTLQMSQYMDKIKAEALTEWGINLPLPEDLYYQDFIEEYKNKI